MILNQIDTISGLITRYNFRHNHPRGTTIKKYKYTSQIVSSNKK